MNKHRYDNQPHPIFQSVDRAIFAKSKEEKDQAKKAKHDWKNRLKKVRYGKKT